MFAFQTLNLVKKYGKKTALDGLNMNVPAASIYGFLGINGAGKTTTFGIAGSYVHATSGEVKIQGKLAVIPQDARFYHGRTVESQLRLFALLSNVHSAEVDQEVNKVLEQVGLVEKRKIAAEKLSHGMYKRLGIAQALLGSPDVLLLDEPTSGLDPENAFEIRKLIKKLGKKKTLVVSSHNLQEISDICSHIGVIHEGRMIFEGKMEEITQSSSKVKYVLGEIDHDVVKSILEQFAWIEKLTIESHNTLHILFSEKEIDVQEVNRQIVKAFFDASIGIREIHAGKGLEETFLEMINK